MSDNFSSMFASSSAAAFAFLFLVGVILILIKSLRTQDKNIADQKRAVTLLAEQMKVCISQQITAQEQVSTLHEQCLGLSARQQQIEKHGSDVQRIDLAMRLLKHGVGSAETLGDMGLSSGEIKLLMRLHSNSKAKNKSVARPEKVARPAVPEKSQSTAKLQSVPVETASEKKISLSEQFSKQGQALAKLFKVRAVG